MITSNGTISNYKGKQFLWKNFFSNLFINNSFGHKESLFNINERFKTVEKNVHIDEFEQQKVRLLNKLIFAISILAFVSGVLISIFESVEHGVLSFLFIPVLLLASYFTHIGKTKLAFVYFVFSDFAVQTLLIFIASPNFGLSYYYLLVPLIVCIFFEERPVLRTTTILLSLILFIVAQFVHLIYEPILVNNHTTLFKILTFTIYFTISYFLVRFYLIEIKTYRKKNKNIFNELNAKNNSLQSFNRIAAHDLKEPLNTVIGFASLLESRFSKSNFKGDLEVEALLHIKDASKRMKDLVDDLMIYSESENSVKETTKVNLNEVLIDVEKNLYSAIVRSKAKITIGDLPVISANKNFMRNNLHQKRRTSIYICKG